MKFRKFVKILLDDGAHKTDIAKEIGINRNTLDNLLREDPQPIPIESTVRSIMKWSMGSVMANDWYSE